MSFTPVNPTTPESLHTSTSAAAITPVNGTTTLNAKKASVTDANGITYEAVSAGTGGNSITVDVDEPASAGALSVGVVGNAITVTLAKAATAFASLVIGARDKAVKFLAQTKGSGGNAITVEYADPGVPSSALSVDVASSAITVNLPTTDGDQAALTTAMTGANNDITLTAVEAGTGGNSITLALIDPSENDAELSIEVTGTDIVANLATGPAGAITTTAAELIEALNDDEDVAALVTAALAAANDGTGVVTALAEDALEGGGENYTIVPTTARDIRLAVNADAAAFALVQAITPMADGAGLITEEVAADNLAGGATAVTSTVRDVMAAVNAHASAKLLVKATSPLILLERIAVEDNTNALAGGLAGCWSLDNEFARSFRATAAGNVAVLTYNGDEAVIPVLAGEHVNLAIRGVRSTSTTATGIVAFV